MRKADIIKAITQHTGIDNQVAQTIVDEFMLTIMETLKSGENVYLRGFGTFKIAKQAERISRDINKGISIIVPAYNVPKFKPGAEFLDSVK